MKKTVYELIPGEEVLYEGRLSRHYVRMPIYVSLVGLLILASTLIYILITLDDELSDVSSIVSTVLLFAGALVLVLPIRKIISRQIEKRTFVMTITSKQVLVRSGLLKKSATDVPLDQCAGVGIYQTLPGRVFNYGTVFQVDGIDDPYAFKRELLTAVDAYKRKTFGNID